MKQTTIRMHMNPVEALGTVGHVIDKDFRDREAHVNANGEFEVWVDKGVYNVYKENFEQVIKDYNEKQKRKDRRITDENGDEITAYIKSIKECQRGKRKKVIEKKMPDGTMQKIEVSNDNGQRVLYELVVSAGNCNKLLDDKGRVKYTPDGHEIHPQRIEREINKRALKRFCDEFEATYQNFKVALCAYHADEEYMNAKGNMEWGIEHAHINFIPVAGGYQRGLSVQASVSKALEQMGFRNRIDGDGIYRNAYTDFCTDAQMRFETILQQEYLRYYVEDKKMRMEDIEELEIIHPSRGKGKQNLDPDVFRATKEMENRKCAVQADLLEITEKKEAVEEEVKTAKKRLEKANTEAEKAQDTLLDMLSNADECRADAKYEVMMMRQEMDEEIVDAKLEKREAEERAREAEKYKEMKEEQADAYFDDTVKMAKEMEAEAKKYIQSCYTEYNEDFEKCKILLTNIRNDISEMEKEVDEMWDEDFSVDIDSEVREYLEGHCIVDGGKQVSLYDDFVKKMEEKKRRSDSTGDFVKKIKERVTSRIDSIEDAERFLQMRCSGEDFTEGFER